MNLGCSLELIKCLTSATRLQYVCANAVGAAAAAGVVVVVVLVGC